MDLFSQAEHDEDAQSILLCPDAGFVARVEQSIDRLLPGMQRREIIETALRVRGARAAAAATTEGCAMFEGAEPLVAEMAEIEPAPLADEPAAEEAAAEAEEAARAGHERSSGSDHGRGARATTPRQWSSTSRKLC